MKFRESALAHKYLDGLRGVEIGGSAHNSFGLNTINVDMTDEMTIFKEAEVKHCGEYMKVDVVAQGDDLPFKDGEYDFVINSHVIEHFTNPIKAILEWYRVIRSGGFIFIICPHKERTFDSCRERTPIQDVLNDYYLDNKTPSPGEHEHVWITEDLLEIIFNMKKTMDFNVDVIEVQDVDDKVGNGFTILLKKI